MEQTTDTRTWEDIITQVFGKAKEDPDYAKRKITPEWIIQFIRSKVMPYEIDQVKRRTVRTVVERVSVMWEKEQIPRATPEQITELEESCKEAFFFGNINMYLRSEKILLPQGAVTAYAFPSRFVPVMDAIIRKYFKDNNSGLNNISQKGDQC